jgi:hypothetical protein
MCPDCIIDHTELHKNKNTHGEFKTIDQVVGKIYQSLNEYI